MPFSTKTYEQFVSDVVTAWAGLLNLNPNLPSGDPLLAIFQAHALCGLLFVQSQLSEVNNLTRAETSFTDPNAPVTPDLASWLAQFNFEPLPAVQATGEVQFSVRTVLASDILIPPGVVVQTADGSIQYEVIADTTQAAWSPSQNGYVLPAGSLSINATVQAVDAGTASNVQVGALSQLVSSITGVSFVTNLAAIENGTNAESNAAALARFQLDFNTVNARTTYNGILFAASSVPGVVAVSLLENQNRYGDTQLGYGVVIIDDGTGSPSSELIAAVTDAVASVNAPVRGFTIRLLVIGPTLENVSIALNVRVNPNSTEPEATVLQNVENAVIDYVNSQEIGQTLYLNNLSYIARGADPNVVAVQAGSVLINGTAADLDATPQMVIRTNNTMTTIGTY